MDFLLIFWKNIMMYQRNAGGDAFWHWLMRHLDFVAFTTQHCVPGLWALAWRGLEHSFLAHFFEAALINVQGAQYSTESWMNRETGSLRVKCSLNYFKRKVKVFDCSQAHGMISIRQKQLILLFDACLVRNADHCRCSQGGIFFFIKVAGILEFFFLVFYVKFHTVYFLEFSDRAAYFLTVGKWDLGELGIKH